jgi:hypothetical protein
MKAMQEKVDTDLKAIKEDIKVNQEKTRRSGRSEGRNENSQLLDRRTARED